MAKIKNPFEPGQTVKFVVLSTQEEKKRSKSPLRLFASISPTRRGVKVPKEKREKWEKADPNYLKKGKKQMFFSRGYPKLMGDEHPAYTGNAEREFRKIAKEFMKTVELSSRRK